MALVTNETKHVYIVDDDTLVRQSIHSWLSTGGYAPRSFSTPLDFIEDLPNLEPGCALLDVRMPVLDGIEALEKYGDRLSKIEVIMMTGHADVDMAVAAMKLGATDFIEKPFKPNVLMAALENAFEKLIGRASKAEQATLATARIGTLTNREREVLTGISSGLSNKLIAYELNLSVRTVEMHRANVMKKLGVRSQAQLVKLAMEAAPPT